MNSKQRRISKRKHKYIVELTSNNYGWTQLLEITRWLRKIQGSYCHPEHDRFEFSNEQDAIMFALKFSAAIV